MPPCRKAALGIGINDGYRACLAAFRLYRQVGGERRFTCAAFL
jgi:hypothetical protein